MESLSRAQWSSFALPSTFPWKIQKRAKNYSRRPLLLEGKLAFLGADFPFHFAHRGFIAAEIRFWADALM